jgi:hypothetical protein
VQACLEIQCRDAITPVAMRMGRMFLVYHLRVIWLPLAKKHILSEKHTGVSTIVRNTMVI